MILSDLEWLSKKFNDTKRRAVSATAELLVVKNRGLDDRVSYSIEYCSSENMVEHNPTNEPELLMPQVSGRLQTIRTTLLCR